MSKPDSKCIGNFEISVDFNGWPRWTRITGHSGFVEILNEEQAHDLHYALSRIVEFLDDAKVLDRKRGIEA